MTYNYSKTTTKKGVQGRNFTLANTHRTHYLQPNKLYISYTIFVYICIQLSPFKQCPQYRQRRKVWHNDSFNLSRTKCVLIKFRILWFKTFNLTHASLIINICIQYNLVFSMNILMLYRYWKPWPNDLSDLLNYKQNLRNPAEATEHRGKYHKKMHSSQFNSIY